MVTETERKPSEALDEDESRILQIKADMLLLFARLEAEVGRSKRDARAAEEELRRREFRFHSERDLAGMLQVSVDTVQRLRQERDLPHLRIGNLVRFTDEHVEAWSEALTRPAPRPRAVPQKRAS